MGDSTAHPFYNDGSRTLQDRFDTRRLADRLEQVTMREAFTDEDRAFIGRASMFFLATADADGRPDCSYKGGIPGFVQVIDPQTLVFPSYDGNGQFRSLGNMLLNPQVGMLFICASGTIRCSNVMKAPTSSCACAPKRSFRTARVTFTSCRRTNCPRTRRDAITNHRYRRGRTWMRFAIICRRRGIDTRFSVPNR
jgi:hypothetical protein